MYTPNFPNYCSRCIDKVVASLKWQATQMVCLHSASPAAAHVPPITPFVPTLSDGVEVCLCVCLLSG
jgi:hypothetical protein